MGALQDAQLAGKGSNWGIWSRWRKRGRQGRAMRKSGRRGRRRQGGKGNGTLKDREWGKKSATERRLLNESE